MKIIPTLILLAGFSTGFQVLAQPQPPGSEPKPEGAPASTNAAPAETTPLPTAPPDTSVIATIAPEKIPAPTITRTNGDGGLRLNFRNAPLEIVLNYLSEAAGFIIVLDPAVHEVKGKVDVWSNQPMTKDEAVDLLNTVLSKNGYTAIRNGRTLTIVNRDDAKTKDIPVRSGFDPGKIPRNDEVVTQIIPVRFVNAVQLMKDLQPLMPQSATLTANEAGNALVVTDSQANIHRVAEIVHAIDNAEGETEIRVFRLHNADPVEMADLLTGLFPDDSKSEEPRSSVRFGESIFDRIRSYGDSRREGRDGRSSDSSSQNQQRAKKKSKILAMADQRTASLIVSAPADLMNEIETMIEKLDSSTAKKQKVFVYSLENADAQQVEQVLKDMFEKNNTNNRNSRSTTSQNNALQNRSSQNQNTTSGTGVGNTGTGIGGQRNSSAGGQAFP